MVFLRSGAIFIWFEFCHAMGDTDFGRHPQWWLGSGSCQDQTASCYPQDNSQQSQIFERSKTDFQHESYHDEHMVFMMIAIYEPYLSVGLNPSLFPRISPSFSLVMMMLVMFLMLNSLVTGMPRRNSKYAKDWVQLDKDHWRGHLGQAAKRTRWDIRGKDCTGSGIWFWVRNRQRKLCMRSTDAHMYYLVSSDYVWTGIVILYCPCVRSEF